VPVRLKALKPKDWQDEPVTLGQHLKKRRRKLGLLQREVASKLGVALDTYRFWEVGRTRPWAASWAKIISFLGYDPHQAPTNLGAAPTGNAAKAGMDAAAGRGTPGLGRGHVAALRAKRPDVSR